MYISSLTYHRNDRYFPCSSFSRKLKWTHVFLVDHDEVILYQSPHHEFRILLLGDQNFWCEFWIGDVDRDDLLSRCVFIGHQVEDCTVVSDASGAKKPKLGFRIEGHLRDEMN